MDNGTFVDNLLDYIKRVAEERARNVEGMLESVRDYYSYNDDHYEELFLSTLLSKEIVKKIDLRVKDMFDVLDPMWFVVALYHRNKGGLWRDMHKYGVKKEYASSYKVEKDSNDEPTVYTDKFNSDALPTL